MMQSRRDALIPFVIDAVEREPSLTTPRFAGRTLLHFASGAGCLRVVESLLRLGADANARDGGSHTPLYRVANECGSDDGPEIVRALVDAGGDVNASGGVKRTTPLHMAARRGFMGIAQALLDRGAAAGAKDIKGDTPLQRARNCRRDDVVRLLQELNA
jgi:ankyrin repeat protein